MSRNITNVSRFNARRAYLSLKKTGGWGETALICLKASLYMMVFILIFFFYKITAAFDFLFLYDNSCIHHR